MRRACLLFASLLVGAPAYGAGADISLSDETAYLRFLSDSSSLGYGGADIGAGAFFNEADDWLISGNLLVSNNPGSGNPWQFGVGTKAYYAEINDFERDDDVGALAIGGLVRYHFPSETPTAIALEGYASPEITTFGEADRFREFNIRGEVEIVPSTRAYVGYRLMEADLDGRSGDYEFDDNIHVGIRVFF